MGRTVYGRAGQDRTQARHRPYRGRVSRRPSNLLVPSTPALLWELIQDDRSLIWPQVPHKPWAWNSNSHVQAVEAARVHPRSSDRPVCSHWLWSCQIPSTCTSISLSIKWGPLSPLCWVLAGVEVCEASQWYHPEWRCVKPHRVSHSGPHLPDY